MTNYKNIKKIGYTQAFKAINVGLIIAYAIMASLAGPFWLFQFDYAPSILFAAMMIYVVGYFIGGQTAIWVAKRNKLAILFGIVSGFLIVWVATFFGSLIGFIKEGLEENDKIFESISDYIFNPIATVTLFGLLPIILVGIWFGISIKKKVNKI